VASIVADGHQVFSHGYDHHRFAELDDRAIRDQVERCESILRRHRPTPSPYLVRLPYGSGHRDARVHLALRAWRTDCEIVDWGYSFEDYRLADGCTSEDDLRRRCDTAVDAAFRDRRLRGAILLLHEDPFDIEAPLAPVIAPLLLDKVLRQATASGIAIAHGLDAPVAPRWTWFSRRAELPQAAACLVALGGLA
jgi:peptidoglycan/xylan/chitin deacetylase (PgdA/CDA1 family)